MWGISWLSEELLDFQEGFNSKDLVRNLTDGFQGDFSDYALGK